MKKESIGTRLRHLRAVRGLTMDDVGKVTDISKQTLYKYEKDIITNIPSDKIEALAKVYDVKPSYIMGWVDVDMSADASRLVLDAQAKAHVRAYLSLSKEDRATVDKITRSLASEARDAGRDSQSSTAAEDKYA